MRSHHKTLFVVFLALGFLLSFSFQNCSRLNSKTYGSNSFSSVFLPAAPSPAASFSPAYKSPGPSLAALSSALDFGGMFGYGSTSSGLVTFANPATGKADCPNGYAASQILGTDGADFPIYLCAKPHVAGSFPLYDFGGIYGSGAGATYLNPATADLSCPTGYQSSQILGTVNQDNPLYFCYRAHAGDSTSALIFGGLYGAGADSSGNQISYGNPALPGDPAKNIPPSPGCPFGYIDEAVFGIANVDWPVRLCYKTSNYPSPLVFELISSGTTAQDCLGDRGGIEHRVYHYKGTLRAHVFYPPGYQPGTTSSAKLPTLAVFHGGGWQYGEAWWWFKPAQFFASRGLIVADFEYLLGDPRADLQVPFDGTRDAVSAMRWLRKNAAALGVDTDRIITSGDSAGGQLALAVGLANTSTASRLMDETGDDAQIPVRPLGAAPIYPVISVEGRLGGSVTASDVGAISPLDLLNADNVMPMSIAVGDIDVTTPTQIARDFCAQANSLTAGICQFYEVTGCGTQRGNPPVVGCDHAFLSNSAGYPAALKNIDEFAQKVLPGFSFYGGTGDVSQLLMLKTNNQCQSYF